MTLYKWSLSEDGRVLYSGTEPTRADALEAIKKAAEREKRRGWTYYPTASTNYVSRWIIV